MSHQDTPATAGIPCDPPAAQLAAPLQFIPTADLLQELVSRMENSNGLEFCSHVHLRLASWYLQEHLGSTASS